MTQEKTFIPSEGVAKLRETYSFHVWDGRITPALEWLNKHPHHGKAYFRIQETGETELIIRQQPIDKGHVLVIKNAETEMTIDHFHPNRFLEFYEVISDKTNPKYRYSY